MSVDRGTPSAASAAAPPGATARPRPRFVPATKGELRFSGNELADTSADQKKAMVLISMLSRIGAPGRVLGSSNALCPVKRARPSVSES